MTEIGCGFLIVGGACLIVVGLVRGIGAARSRMLDPGRALGFVRGLRVSLVGIALTGLGFGWLLEQSWLVALSLAFAGEELWESSVVIGALKHGVEGPRGRKRIPPPPLRMPTPDTLLPSYRRGA